MATRTAPLSRKFLSFPGPVKLLDLGFGGGCLPEILKTAAPSRAKVHYCAAAAAAGPQFRDGVFDFVFSSDEAALRGGKLAKAAARALKKGGTLVHLTADGGAGLKESLAAHGLFLMKTCGGQEQYNTVRHRDEPAGLRIERSYQRELFEAVAALRPGTAARELLFFSKGRTGLLDEIRKLFPGTEAAPLGHPGNSALFAAGGGILKYLPASALEKYLEAYRLLSGKPGLNFPKLLGISESEVSDNYLVSMEKAEGTQLTDIWKGLSETKKLAVVRRLASALKQIHSVRFRAGAVPPHFMSVEGCTVWKDEIYTFCLAGLAHCKEKNIIGKELRAAFLSFLRGSIGQAAAAEYVLLHRDLNSNNIMAGRDGKLTFLFDFETCSAGDKYLDLAANGLFFEDKYREALYKAYGVPGNFDKITGIYRLLSVLCFLRTRKIRKGREEDILEFIRTGRSGGASPAAWTEQPERFKG